jgi:site-specific recombinase XerD
MNEMIDLETRLSVFEAYLKGLDRSRHSVRAYLSDLHLIAQLFEGHTGEKFVVSNLLDDDVKNWRDEMGNKQKAFTINRKLAALSSFLCLGG